MSPGCVHVEHLKSIWVFHDSAACFVHLRHNTIQNLQQATQLDFPSKGKQNKAVISCASSSARLQRNRGSERKGEEVHLGRMQAFTSTSSADVKPSRGWNSPVSSRYKAYPSSCATNHSWISGCSPLVAHFDDAALGQNTEHKQSLSKLGFCPMVVGMLDFVRKTQHTTNKNEDRSGLGLWQHHVLNQAFLSYV